MPPLLGELRGQTSLHCQLPCIEGEKNAICPLIEYLADGVCMVTQILLNPTKYTLSKEKQVELENLGRSMSYALHCSRANKPWQLNISLYCSSSLLSTLNRVRCLLKEIKE